MNNYNAVFFEDGKYIGVEFPDLPGCFSQADNREQAEKSAQKALDCYFGKGDDSHQKLFNEQTQQIIVIPMNVEFLGEKLQKKIIAAAGIETL